jgi:hypothetical protein
VWDELQDAAWVTTLATTQWLYGLLLVVHYSALFVCVGTTVLLDLRILGAANRNQPLSSLARQLRLWTWLGFGAAVVSGFLLFASKARLYVEATPFRVKILIIALAVIADLVVEWSVPKWDRARAIPATATVLALISIALWLGAILAAVEIPALTGLG